MNRSGNDFLAGSAFTGHQHVSRRIGHAFCQIQRTQKFGALSDNTVHRAFAAGNHRAQRLIFIAHLIEMQSAFDGNLQLREVQRLDDKVVSTSFDRLERDFRAAVSGHNNYRNRDAGLLQRFRQFHAAHFRKAQIRNNHVTKILVGRDILERLFRVIEGHELVTFRAKKAD